jgi:hypothetical protein
MAQLEPKGGRLEILNKSQIQNSKFKKVLLGAFGFGTFVFV